MLTVCVEKTFYIWSSYMEAYNSFNAQDHLDLFSGGYDTSSERKG